MERNYDFQTVLPRHNVGSMKWDELEKVANLPENIIPFSVADMEFVTIPEVTDGLKKFIDRVPLGYGNPTPEYKQAVKRWLARRHSWDIDTEWICDSPGVINAFFTAVQAFTEPGEGVLLMTPVYYPMYMAISRNGRNLVENKLINRGGRYEIDFDDFERKAAEEDTKLLILCSPHNPTGRVWTKEELTRIGDICLRHGIVVCSDEIHNDLIMPSYRHVVFASLKKEFAQISLTCTAPSKTFNLAGLQTANTIIPNQKLRERFWAEVCKHEGNPKCNLLGLEACRLAYENGDEWLEGALQVIYNNCKMVTDFIQREFPSIIITPLEGTYLLWMDFRQLGIEAHELAKILREEAFLFFDDGFIFGDAGEGFERWNLACPTQYVEDALQRLKRTLLAHLN